MFYTFTEENASWIAPSSAYGAWLAAFWGLFRTEKLLAPQKHGFANLSLNIP